MAGRTFFFAGGGTGGHIYPAIAIAERLVRLDPDARIQFFCSRRSIDRRILSGSGYAVTELPATGLSLRPDRLLSFVTNFFGSYRKAKAVIGGHRDAVVVGVGGFVAPPVCLAAKRMGLPVVLVNVDIVPGRANRFVGRFADRVFVQFEDSGQYFKRAKGSVSVVGCPLRSGFADPVPSRAIERLGLDEGKRILLVTGASSGSESINRTLCILLDKLEAFAGTWQVVHLTGTANYEQVKQMYAGAAISHKVLDYYDEMADLLAAADLLIGRSGAVSVAEYAAVGAATICMPYPHHRDRHQYLNAEKLVEAGAAVVVDDLPDEQERAEWLWEELEPLMRDEKRRLEMKEGGRKIAAGTRDAAERIAEVVLALS